jgi:hypothetical protein
MLKSNYAFPSEYAESIPSPVVGAINIPCVLTEFDLQCIFEGFIQDSTWIEEMKMEEDYGKDVTGETWSEKFARGAIFTIKYENPDSNNPEYITVRIYREKLIIGLQKYVEKEKWVWDIADVDASIADTMLQYTMFGKVIFG